MAFSNIRKQSWVMICSFCPCQTCQSMGLGGFPMVAIEFIAFACYPPRSDTSQDGGLVDLSES